MSTRLNPKPVTFMKLAAPAEKHSRFMQQLPDTLECCYIISGDLNDEDVSAFLHCAKKIQLLFFQGIHSLTEAAFKYMPDSLRHIDFVDCPNVNPEIMQTERTATRKFWFTTTVK
jgi:hypothetical protein